MKFIPSQKYEAFKYHWSGTRLPVQIEVTPISVDQLDTATAQVLASYCFKDILSIQMISDVTHGFIVVSKNFGRKVRLKFRTKLFEDIINVINLLVSLKL